MTCVVEALPLPALCSVEEQHWSSVAACHARQLDRKTKLRSWTLTSILGNQTAGVWAATHEAFWARSTIYWSYLCKATWQRYRNAANNGQKNPSPPLVHSSMRVCSEQEEKQANSASNTTEEETDLKRSDLKCELHFHTVQFCPCVTADRKTRPEWN